MWGLCEGETWVTLVSLCYVMESTKPGLTVHHAMMPFLTALIIKDIFKQLFNGPEKADAAFFKSRS